MEKSGVEGVAWFVDAKTDRVVVTIDKTVDAAEVADIRRTAGADATKIKIKRTNGVFRPLGSAGDAIYGGGYRCSLGFNVRSGSTYYFLTAGHCGDVADTWYANSSHSTLIGPTVGSSFPGNDYGTKALGLTSGGSGNCSVGGTTFYQPVTEAASRYGVTVY